MTASVLAGTRVLDVGRYIAGPFCAALLADPRPAPVARPPVSLSRTPLAIRHRPPMLGEHTAAILTNSSLGNPG